VAAVKPGVEVIRADRPACQLCRQNWIGGLQGIDIPSAWRIALVDLPRCHDARSSRTDRL